MERWLQRGFQIVGGTAVGRMLSSGADWQLYSTGNNGYALAISQSLYDCWGALVHLPEGLLTEAPIEGRNLYLAYDGPENMIASVKYGPYPKTYTDAMAFAIALRQSREVIPSTAFGDAIYFERYSLILPTFGDDEHDDQTVLCRWIASGVELSVDRFDRLCEIASWLSPSALADVMKHAGFAIANDNAVTLTKSREKEAVADKSSQNHTKHSMSQIGNHFSLPGRPALELFFNEHITDIIRNHDRYKRMGIDFPSAVILHGPPGCGKTFAVERLIEFLGWPSFNIDSGSIGSPFIHDTSKKISEVFDKAIESAPSVLVIDEMEAFLSARNTSQAGGQHHVEEVAEFLRRIPEANSKHVLVIAMTNLIDSIDPAILRRGRFDHIIEVQMPSKEEVDALLHYLLASLPTSEDLDYSGISSKLEGHAMSDVTFVVKEAGRLAVKRNEDLIGNEIINEAIASLPKKKETSRKIGF